MKTSQITAAFLLASLALFSGCGDDSDSVMEVPEYNVKLLNLTAAQPMSPMLVSSSSLFSVGKQASLGLETLAESGDNSVLLDDSSVSGTKLIVPSQSDTISIGTSASKLFVVSMLVNTNDGFVGLEGYDVSSLHVNDTKTLYLNVYDAGTEANSEDAGSVPGLGGEGFNAAREASNRVSLHSGVISKDEGLMSSDLSAMHKFDNPAAALVITRTK